MRLCVLQSAAESTRQGSSQLAPWLLVAARRYSKSLAELLAEEAPPPGGLPLPRLLRYAAQTLGALHELHSLDVVMADLKRQNLLVDHQHEL